MLLNGILNFPAQPKHTGLIPPLNTGIISRRPPHYHPGLIFQKKPGILMPYEIEKLYLRLLEKEIKGEYLTETEKFQLRCLRALKHIDTFLDSRVIVC